MTHSINAQWEAGKDIIGITSPLLVLSHAPGMKTQSNPLLLSYQTYEKWVFLALYV
jgi:hypothetical protein